MTTSLSPSETAVSIARELQLTGHSERLRSAFTAEACQTPYLLWDPAEADVQNPLISRFFALCRDMADDNGRVRAAGFALDAIKPMDEWFMRLRVEGEPDSFRYLQYGAAIAQFRGYDPTGQIVSDIGGHIALFFQACYLAVMERKQWLLTSHEPPKVVFAREWRRLIVPLFGEDGETVTEFAVLNFPDNELRAGLEIIPDPVLIADADLCVRFANRAAREFFGHHTQVFSSLDLETFTGLALTPADPPEILARKGYVHDIVSLSLRGHIVERFLVTLSGIEHFGRAFYLITLRPAYSSPNGKAKP